MIISNSVTGPRFSADAVASDVSRFLAQRPTMTTSGERAAGVSGFPTSIERLYPSLFEARPAFSAIVAVRHAFETIATSLHLPSHGRSL